MRTRLVALLFIAAMLPTSAWAEIAPQPIQPIQPIAPVLLQPTWCTITYTDVHSTDYFYDAVRSLTCRGIVSGYADNTFRPYNAMTRGQAVKWVIGAANFAVVNPPTNTFADVLPTSPWFTSIETAAAHGVVSGYSCGGPGEPCDAVDRPYFRPYADATRSQAVKMLVVAEGWSLSNPAVHTFADVPPASPWYSYIETAAAHGILSGYACGGPGEPCDAANRPYFRAFADSMRGQFARTVYLAL